MMKNKVKIYATVLAELIMEAKRGSEEKIAANFFRFILKNNYVAKAYGIVTLAENIVLRKMGNKRIILQTARNIGAKKITKSFFKEGDIIENAINPELIAGVKVIINNEQQLDFSLKNKLDSIF